MGNCNIPEMAIMDEKFIVKTNLKTTLEFLSNPSNHLLYCPGWKGATLQNVSKESYLVMHGQTEHLINNKCVGIDSLEYNVESRRNQQALNNCSSCKILVSEYSVQFKLSPKIGGGTIIHRVVKHFEI